MGEVPQTSLTLGRKRETLRCALPGGPSPVTKEPLPSELLMSPTVPCSSGHRSEVVCCLFGPHWYQCLMSVVTYMWVTAAVNPFLLVFLIYCKNPACDLPFIFRSLFLDVIVRKQQDLRNETPCLFLASILLLPPKGSCECILPL